MGTEGQGEKLGLALSGGGFRAALFHVGVLARLAESGVLPRVEVISTVSGGSIVGALYYLCLKQRLDKQADGTIGRDGYVELVADVERRLRDGIRRNIRTRVFANPLKNVAMLSPRYSRSDRIGDLYDRYLYKGAWEAADGPRPRRHPGRPFSRQRQVELSELLIEPGGAPFDPDTHNAAREEKVPILLLNATSLNSGHNWRFEAIRMGESRPDDPVHREAVAEVDKNMLLETAYFRPAWGTPTVPEHQADFPLGLAVAASAAVPGVFQPLAISGMYEGVRVQLVDGGVQDNQGVQGLFDRGCTGIVVSDASGQMRDAEAPSTRIPGVLSRSASIAGDRIRDEQLVDLLVGPYRPRALMHLRKGLAGKLVAPSGSEPRSTPRPSSAEFGVHPDVQWALSRIRTDLDRFSDTEASALGLDGYLMSGPALAESGLAAAGDVAGGPSGAWAFWDEELRDRMSSGAPELVRSLEIGEHKFLRGLRRRFA